MRAALRLFILFSVLLTAGSAFGADRAIIVMDASGSMWGRIGGKTKIEIARETLAGVMPSIPGDMELGLIAYGAPLLLCFYGVWDLLYCPGHDCLWCSPTFMLLLLLGPPVLSWA